MKSVYKRGYCKHYVGSGRFSLCVIFLLLFDLLALTGTIFADPSLRDNGNGTMTASWSFDSAVNYTYENLSISPGRVVLEDMNIQMVDTSLEDFQQGTAFFNVDLTSYPGNVTLKDTLSAGSVEFLDIRVDEGDGKDVYITQTSQNRNYGNSSFLGVMSESEERILIQFNLSSLQSLDLIVSSELRLNLQSASNSLPLNVSVHQLNASWAEGSGDGEVTNDGATWRSRDGSNLWAQPGGDFNVLPEDIVRDIGNQTKWYVWNVTQLAQDWVAGRKPNYGLILLPMNIVVPAQEKRFHSKESDTPGTRPRLRVTYISPEGGVANGTFISRRIEGQSTVNWESISWNSTVPPQTNLSIYTRSGDCFGDWSNWSNAYSSSSGSQITSPPGQCLQYKVEMATLNRTKTPVFEEVRVSYSRYVPEGSIETEDFTPVDWIGWEAFNSSYLLPQRTNITFWISTDSGKSWTEIYKGGVLQSISSPTIRLRANLTSSDLSLTPTLIDMEISYQYYGSLDHIHMSLATWTGTTDEWVDIDAIGHDSFHHNVLFLQEWETDDPWGSVDGSGLYLPGKIGTWRVYCNNSDDSISNYTTVNVLPGSRVRIAIDPWDPGTLTTDESLLFNATGFDSKGNMIGPVIANWTLSGGIGWISSGPSSFALFDPSNPGTGKITADDGIGHTNTTNTIEVVVGARSRIGIEPWSPGLLTADDSLDFTAYDYDADGNRIGLANVTWIVTGGIGEILPGPSETTTFEATTVGTGTVMIDDGLGHRNATDLIVVTAGSLTSIKIDPNPAELEPGEYRNFSATGYDLDGNVVHIVDSVWETNAGLIVYSSPEVATLRAQESELQDGWIRVTAVLQNNLSCVADVSVVARNVRPMILGTIPDQLKPEDYGSWTLDLSSYASDAQDPLSNLTWFFTNHDPALIAISGDNAIGNHLITFTTVPDAYGVNELTIWLRDTDGYTDSQTLYVNITSVNDRPTIQSITPFTVHYDLPYKYYFYDYVSDVETSKENLTLTSDQPENIYFDGLWGTFTYPKEYDGQTVYPIVTVRDEDYGEMSTVLAITVTDDYVPELVKDLPDVTLYEGQEVINYFDLDDYFDDPDHDSLFYTSGNVHVDIIINDDHTVDFKAPMDWSGEEVVTFRAIDTSNARAEDIVLITVIPVNDPPTISGVPDLVVHYDDPTRPDYNFTLDLEPYVRDVDNDSSELIIYTDDPYHIFFYENKNTVMVLHYPESMKGQTIPVRITVSDGLSEAYQDINVTVLDDWSPEITRTIPDITFYEDTELLEAFKIDDYFYDPDGDELAFSSVSVSVVVEIDALSLMVSLSAVRDWYGEEYVTFRATDVYGALREQTVKVTVLPVNDAPVILDIPNQIVRKNNIYTLDLNQYISDADNSFSDLMIRANGDHPETPTVAGYILILSYFEEGTDRVHLEVSDGEKTALGSFNVTIVGPPPPSLWEQIYWPWSLITALLALSILVVFVRWFFAKIHIDEVFLIYKNGSLISHCVIERETEIDEDIFSNMLTAIQEFIRDSFREVEDAPVKKIEFGKQKIIIERGKEVYLAVVYSGFETRKNLQPIRDAMKEIERKYAKELANWDGFIFRYSGVESILRKHLGRSKIRRVSVLRTSRKPLKRIEKSSEPKRQDDYKEVNGRMD